MTMAWSWIKSCCDSREEGGAGSRLLEVCRMCTGKAVLVYFFRISTSILPCTKTERETVLG